MKKVLTILTIISFLTFALASNISAFTATPSTGTIAVGGSTQVQILANPSATSSAVTVNLDVTGMTVTGFSAGSGMLSIPECTGGGSFTASSVCISLAPQSGEFTVGQVLGTVTVQGDANGTGIIAAGAGSQYDTGQTVTGSLASFTIGSGGGTTSGSTTSGGSTTGSTTAILPNTAFGDSNSDYLTIGIGLIAFGLIISIGYSGFKREEELVFSEQE